MTRKGEHTKIQPMTRKGEKNELLILKTKRAVIFKKKSFFFSLWRYFPDSLGIRESFHEIAARRKRVKNANDENIFLKSLVKGKESRFENTITLQIYHLIL